MFKDDPELYSHPFVKKSTRQPEPTDPSEPNLVISPLLRDVRFFPTAQVTPIDLDTMHPFLDFPKPEFAQTDARPFRDARIPTHLLAKTESDDSDIASLSRLVSLSASEIRDLTMFPLVVKRVVNMTRKGKIPSMYAMVVVGNRDGLVGIGEGKDEGVPNAIKKANNAAIKHLQYIDRYQRRTVFGQVEYKFHGTRVVLRPRPPGFGNRSNHFIHEILKCVGIQDISAKVYGSRNGMNVAKATIEALKAQILPDEIARARSKTVVDVQKVFYS